MIEALALFALPFGGGGVHRQDEVFARLVTGIFDGLQDVLDGIFIGLEVRCETAFVADGGGVAFRLQELLEGVEDFGAPAETFLEGGSADGHDHEFLGVDGVRGMGAAVQDVHHRDRETVAVLAAEVTVQRDAKGRGSGFGGGDGDREDAVGAEVGFIFGAVGLQHGGVDFIDVPGIDTDNSFFDDSIDVLDRFGDAFAAVAGLVPVAEFEGFEFTGGCAGGSGSSADRAVCQDDFSFDGGVTAGVDDLATDDVYDFKFLLHDDTTSFRDQK